MIVLLCCVGGGTNRCFDTYRNSRARGPTPQPTSPPLSRDGASCRSDRRDWEIFLQVIYEITGVFFSIFFYYDSKFQTFRPQCVIVVGG